MARKSPLDVEKALLALQSKPTQTDVEKVLQSLPPNATQQDLERALADDAVRRRRLFVETLASYGLDPDTIGMLMAPSVDGDTVKKDYALELVRGPARADLETVAQLRAGVLKGNMTAIIWWTKSRMGWTEKGPGEKEKPAASESAPPTPMPTASQLSQKILNFPRK